MQTILITVEALQRSVDLEVPGEIPVGELIPLLLEICKPAQAKLAPPAAPSTWGLGPKDGDEPLGEDYSLIDSGVMDGAILVLQNMEAWANQRQRKASWMPRSLSPDRSTGGFGISWDNGGLLPSS
ncbi:MAG TPA: EsaB/YukD family protein [Ktedonobacteraceae bacterium]